jgi:hypothetical protein
MGRSLDCSVGTSAEISSSYDGEYEVGCLLSYCDM